ncbi:MAG: glutamine amidotransferase-related protein, partial [Candidatus Poseidoniaceae archaeon]
RNTNVLGICLGHQAIGLADGMRLIRSPAGPVHGIPVEILHSGGPIFPKEDIIKMTRYNSLILDGVPSTLKINAQQLSSNEIMGITNGTNVHGIQFHPESVGSVHGDKIIRKFLDLERIVEK